jgi:hypothetical protein
LHYGTEEHQKRTVDHAVVISRDIHAEYWVQYAVEEDLAADALQGIPLASLRLYIVVTRAQAVPSVADIHVERILFRWTRWKIDRSVVGDKG